MQTLDDMHDRHLLSHEQRRLIGDWVRKAKTPDAIQAMPEPLWRALSLASVLMDLDRDLTQPPPYELP